MWHAGAIIMGKAGSAQSKVEVFERACVQVAEKSSRVQVAEKSSDVDALVALVLGK